MFVQDEDIASNSFLSDVGWKAASMLGGLLIDGLANGGFSDYTAGYGSHASSDRTIFIGPRGGHYYINASGKKVYI